MTLRRRASSRVVLLAAVVTALLGTGRSRDSDHDLEFRLPLRNQLVLPGPVAFDLRTPGSGAGSLELFLDGTPISQEGLDASPHGVSGSLEVTEKGRHELRAVFTAPPREHHHRRHRHHRRLGHDAFEERSDSRHGRHDPVRPRSTSVAFEVVSLESPDECEILNNAECLLPYPSSRFLVPVGAESRTGYRLAIPQAGMPVLNGPPVSPDPLNRFDGFSPTVQILMHFPAGVDLEASRAPVLLSARCCGQSQVPPYVDVRTYDARSLERGRRRGSPTVLLDADTGERVLHFDELDARTDDPARRIFFLRPAVGLVPGHRYIVAVRHLVDPDGNPVEPEAPFRALRDRAPSSIPALEARRAHFEDIFKRLRRAGIRRRDLILAFDFVVRSDWQLTHELLAMRDDALAWHAANPLQAVFDVGFNAANFHPNCRAEGGPVWRRVRGTFTSPFYLTPNPSPATDGYQGVQLLDVDADGTPVRNGVHEVPFDILVPCSSLDGPLPPILIGHGLFGTGAGMIDSIEAIGESARDLGVGPFDYIAGATDWRGLSSKDLAFLAVDVLGISDNRLDNFPSFAARLKQGMVDTLALAHLMKTGAFNARPYFQRFPGFPITGVFPGPDEDMYYYGISLGGIMGTFFAALTPDVERLHIDVGAINFSLLLQRSTQFTLFEGLLRNIGLVDPMQTALGLGLLHEIWVTSEPAAYARHVTGRVDAPLPGSPAKKILLTPVWLDKQVSNQASEIAARTLGLDNVQGSLVAGLVDIRDVGAPADSGYFVYDAGSFDVFDPAYDAVIPPLANEIPSPVCDPHARRITIPAALEQMLRFLRKDGVVENPCRDDGVCDASEPYERPGGEPSVCDPLSVRPGTSANR